MNMITSSYVDQLQVRQFGRGEKSKFAWDLVRTIYDDCVVRGEPTRFFSAGKSQEDVPAVLFPIYDLGEKLFVLYTRDHHSICVGHKHLIDCWANDENVFSARWNNSEDTLVVTCFKKGKWLFAFAS